ncbi:MAG: hypothetical protein RBT59_12060 [Arcobacteraceae bacterium]|nr:hypothetical protein [Arcobacteraceae bacterium]
MIEKLPTIRITTDDFKQKLADFYSVEKDSFSFQLEPCTKEQVEYIKIENGGVIEFITRESIIFDKLFDLREKEFVDEIEMIDKYILIHLVQHTPEVREDRFCYGKSDSRIFQISRKILKQKLADFYGAEEKNVEAFKKGDDIFLRVIGKSDGFLNLEDLIKVLNKDSKINFDGIEVLAFDNYKLTLSKER